MDEHQIRMLVRQAIARHMGGAPAPAAGLPTAASHAAAPVLASSVVIDAPSPVAPSGHASFAKFHLVRPAGETECVIEPTVTCNHCGHCLCYGH